MVTVLQPRTARDRFEYGARLVLLALLCVATFAVHVNGDPRPRPLDDLYRDLRAGAVSTVVMDRSWPAYGLLSWSTGPFSWHRVIGVPEGEVFDPVTSRLDRERLEPVRAAHLAAISAAAREGGRSVTMVTGDGGFGRLWAQAELERLWPPLAPWGIAAAAVALLGLLAGPRPRQATRWGWFWIFLGGGAAGYALLEPYPIWKGPGDVLREHAPLDGAQGMLLGITLALLPPLTALP